MLRNVTKKEILDSILINMMRCNEWNLRLLFDNVAEKPYAKHWFKS